MRQHQRAGFVVHGERRRLGLDVTEIVLIDRRRLRALGTLRRASQCVVFLRQHLDELNVLSGTGRRELASLGRGLDPVRHLRRGGGALAPGGREPDLAGGLQVDRPQQVLRRRDRVVEFELRFAEGLVQLADRLRAVAGLRQGLVHGVDFDLRGLGREAGRAERLRRLDRFLKHVLGPVRHPVIRR